MKKIVLSLAVVFTLLRCNSVKNVNTSSVSQAATLLSSLSSNSTVQQIASLFSLLDTNNDEAIGSVADNFNVLDTDNSSTLSLTELTGMLNLLK
ncbi:hypothetical protein [Winogradskyella sediminis]|uniref:EF-hand domain-containing protein n=1 Tax=Winogradskyella sediminis TaxID=1382466 RepID=A0A1H1LU03_9FLAO|nr:hypothetical protein [Winogradskyella sediminis]SDR77792.1 hypothetical protein SAMN04489797_0093 [Winogradskyella sediminis]